MKHLIQETLSQVLPKFRILYVLLDRTSMLVDLMRQSSVNLRVFHRNHVQPFFFSICFIPRGPHDIPKG
jgi:hypothetical protein